jgi:AcrR family transcriptional regulator
LGVLTPPAQSRLDELVAAATKTFGQKGFRRTQMADIAAAAGVSPGNLYNYVESKEALFDLVLRGGFGRVDGEVSLPVPATTADRTAAWLRARLDFSDFPVLEAALRRRRAADPKEELAEVVLELYDVLAGMRGAIEVLEHSVPDVPEIAEVFLGVRRELFARVARYVRKRVRTGQFRPLSDPNATARLLVETTSWAATRRLRDKDQVTVSDEAARESVREFVVNALVPDSGRARVTA